VPHDALPTVRLRPGGDGLWRVADAGDAARWGARLRDVYDACVDGGYRGRATAPLLVDAGGAGRPPQVVSNESADMLRLLPAAFADEPVAVAAGVHVWLRPPPGNAAGVDARDVDDVCDLIYDRVNNGVYKCGFAVTQAAYERAEAALVGALDTLEARLRATRFVCSATTVTEADVRLFPTMFRFDAVYARLFKCGRKTVAADLPAIAGWLRDMYALPGVRETCDLDATRDSYYSSLFMLNPGGIVPVAPHFDWAAPHGRERLGA
jgi:glutathionyl-hydroquinone reductase